MSPILSHSEAAGLPGLGPQWGPCHCSQQASLVLNIPTSTTKSQILPSWVLESSWTSRLTTLLGPCQPSTQHHHEPNLALLRLTERLKELLSQLDVGTGIWGDCGVFSLGQGHTQYKCKPRQGMLLPPVSSNWHVLEAALQPPPITGDVTVGC